MKYILQGIKDYCKDCWHDWLFKNLRKFYKKMPITFYDRKTGISLDIGKWKEGNLWHYIQQRKIAKKRKEHAKKENKGTVAI